MHRLPTLLMSGFLSASLAAPAQGQEGTSLYEPFPGRNSIARAERFVDQLRIAGSESGTLNLSREELERGVVVDPRRGSLEPARVRAGEATDRATGGDGLAPSFGWPLGAGVLALAALAAARLPRIASRAV